jgi:hypothetical protein
MKRVALAVASPFVFAFMLGFAFGLMAAERPWKAPKHG